MSESKSALIIANYRYEDPDLQQLAAPAQDAEALARVLADPAIGGFEVRALVNEPSYKVSLEIESFCDNRKHDDLLLLYFSGHGIRDFNDGQLYFATVDTQLVQHNVRRATAVPAQFVNEVMSRSRSRRQILLLDCCYSGAFKQGMLAKGDTRVGAGEQLQGQGRVVLTASDAFQYSFEAEQVHGEGVRSVFTSALVRGLETGEADLDTDGVYALDEVYDYVYSRVSEHQSGQKPMKMGYVEGKIFLGNNPHPRAAVLAPELRESLEDRRPWVRLGAVHELEELLAASNKGRALAAQAALTSLAKQDDSQEVRTAAEKCLAARSAGEKEEAERVVADKAAQEKAEADQIAKAEAERAAKATAEQERLAHEKAEKEKAEKEKAEAVRIAQAEAERAEKAKTERLAAARLAYELARELGTLKEWQKFLAEFPDSPHRNEALNWISSLSTYVKPLRRAGADLIDYAVVFLVMILGNHWFGGLRLYWLRPRFWAGLYWLHPDSCIRLLVVVLGFSICVSKTGKTLGQKLMGTRIAAYGGNSLTFLRSLAYTVAWLAWLAVSMSVGALVGIGLDL